MKKMLLQLHLVLFALALTQCNSPPPGDEMAVTSPDGDIRVELSLENGLPTYSVSYQAQTVLYPSRLGFVFKEAPPLNQNLAAIEVEHSSYDETWEQPWGETRFIRSHYNELRVQLQEQGERPRRVTLVFRVFDDGLGWRYELPVQEHLGAFEIMDEQTEFVFAGDHRAWWIPAMQNKRYEYLYQQSPLSALERVHTPLTLQTSEGLFLSIHEANLTDYASMTLAGTGGNTLQCELVPWSDGVKVKAATPHQTPWRTLQIAPTARDLLTSYLILNLNEPNALGDVSWVRPGKYVGIWWSIHLGLQTWGRGPRHGATTENALRYVDFAAENGLDGVLVEGWNMGWDGNWLTATDAFDFVTPFPDFDIDQVARYAREKDVRLFGHHETGADVHNYERQLEAAFAFYESLGVDTVKTGYAGMRVDDREWHHGQYMVRHYRRVVELAARHHIMLNVHEPIKDTGLRRTYPNMLTREGARGTEYDAKSRDGGNPPSHTVILPFTRMLSGPLDYTPGIFDLLFEQARPNNRVKTTLAKQLALYVVLYSPLQMAADMPENYAGHPAFQFIRDVPVDWQQTLALDAQIGQYVTIARQDRNSQDWYVGSITNEQGRALQSALSFLDPGQRYVAEIYSDSADADWQSNPLGFEISRFLVDSETTLALELAPGGGQAIRLRPADAVDEGTIPVYDVSSTSYQN